MALFQNFLNSFPSTMNGWVRYAVGLSTPNKELPWGLRWGFFAFGLTSKIRR